MSAAVRTFASLSARRREGVRAWVIFVVQTALSVPARANAQAYVKRPAGAGAGLLAFRPILWISSWPIVRARGVLISRSGPRPCQRCVSSPCHCSWRITIRHLGRRIVIRRELMPGRWSTAHAAPIRVAAKSATPQRALTRAVSTPTAHAAPKHNPYLLASSTMAISSALRSYSSYTRASICRSMAWIWRW